MLGCARISLLAPSISARHMAPPLRAQVALPHPTTITKAVGIVSKNQRKGIWVTCEIKIPVTQAIVKSINADIYRFYLDITCLYP
jgi:hypothetical protein